MLIKCDILCLQELVLTKQDCHLLNTCNASYVDYGISPLDASCGILSGRPYGGVGFYGNAPWINILPYLIIVMIGFVA